MLGHWRAKYNVDSKAGGSWMSCYSHGTVVDRCMKDWSANFAVSGTTVVV